MIHPREIFFILKEKKLYANLKKCDFFSSSMVFLGYIVSNEGVKIDPSKVEAILNWLIPLSLFKVRIFHGLTSFYRRFIKEFSSIMAPITRCLKGDKLKWTNEVDDAFKLLKKRMTKASILILPDFNKVFEVECDDSIVGI